MISSDIDPDTPISERPLVEAASRGDAVAIETLLARHLPALGEFIRRRTPGAICHKESASDLSQSVCREVLEDLAGFEYRGEAAFRAWLFKMAEHKIVERLRYYRAQKRDVARERNIGKLPPEAQGTASKNRSPSREAMGREWMERFDEAFESLPEDYKEVLTLSRLFDLPLDDIATQMNRGKDAVRGLLQRATKKLESIVETSDPT